MLLRILVVCFWILALIPPTSAQATRQLKKPAGKHTVRTTPAPPTPAEPSVEAQLKQDPKGWVWVSQIIDLTRQLGGDDNVMTLDGEPLPALRKRRVTMGLVIDEGYILTRLFDVSPNDTPTNITVSSPEVRPAPAKFLGMDAVTGLCVLQVNAPLQSAVLSATKALPVRENIRLYGFHPNLNQNPAAGIIMDRPRRIEAPGQIIKASADFRFNENNPIYYLVSPRLTPVQDCSLVLRSDNSVFGLAIYDTGSEGRHLVYPAARVQTIAQAVIKSHKSLAYGWLGINGQDMLAPISTPGKVDVRPELGVIITVIAPDSPAEQAGLKSKDVLLSVNDRRIETRAQLGTAFSQLPPDSEVALKVRRGKEYKTIKARLIPAPATEPEQQLLAFNSRRESVESELKGLPQDDPNRQHLEAKKKAWVNFINGVFSEAPAEIRLRVFYGIEVQLLTGQLMNYFAVTNGLLIAGVSEQNKAARMGLKAGDVITEVSGKKISNITTLLAALDGTQGDQIEFSVVRRREPMKLKMPR